MGRNQRLTHMQIQPENRNLAIKGVRKLDFASIRIFRKAVGTAARLGLPAIEMDLSQIPTVDACALGVLAAMYRLVGGRPPLGVAVVRLLNPQPAVQQMLELARMDVLFEIVNTRLHCPEAQSARDADLLQAA
jgi:anti-anti-sigma factor